jgi:O-acetyl-ADP-ribose deacetylase (regulator of RNase III)
LIAFKIPPIILEIADGDIAAQTTDAIVNAANNHLWMGSGVAGAIKARGGPQIERDAMAQGPIEAGEAVVTPGGQLPARYVVHAAVMGQDLRTSAGLVDRATRSALAAAEAHRIQSIAFPALGTGVGGFPLKDCARIMIEAIRAQASPGTSLRLVRLVLFGHAAYEAFAEVARELLGPASGSAPIPLFG